jgi:hypothetical protein
MCRPIRQVYPNVFRSDPFFGFPPIQMHSTCCAYLKILTEAQEDSVRDKGTSRLRFSDERVMGTLQSRIAFKNAMGWSICG